MEKNYMEQLLAQIREKRARESVQREVEDHIQEQKASYMADGMTEELAEKKAVADMGDPIETGIALDQIHRPRPAWGMLAIIAALCATGVFLEYMIQTTRFSTEPNPSAFQNQCIYATVGFLILCGVYLMDYTRIAKYARHICTGILLLLLITLTGWFPVFQIRKSLYLTNFYISMDILFYLYLPVYGAVLYSLRSSGTRKLWNLLFYTIAPIFLAFRSAHLSVAINITVIIFILFLTALTKEWFAALSGKRPAYTWLLCFCGAGCLLLPILLFTTGHLAPYQITRLKAWLHPDAFAKEAGYISTIIHNILNSSQLIGQNTALLVSDYPVEFTRSYLLTYITGTFGILAAVALIALIGLLGAKFLHICIRQKNQLGMIMGLGCSLSFILQSVEYVLINLSLLPPGGLYFPLVSYGGSGMLQTCILLGILLSTYRYENILSEPPYRNASVKMCRKTEIKNI